jgi:hypothetical protein
MMKLHQPKPLQPPSLPRIIPLLKATLLKVMVGMQEANLANGQGQLVH